ncbi:outer membrane beta-barrel protein [Myxococcota bacterium]|nr:outer membrane beta-barrel protein [Myxococcota bacterium]
MTGIRFGLFALGLVACLAPSAGRAVDLGLAPYVQYDIGATFMRNQNLTRANPVGLNGSVQSETGFNVGGALGVRFLEHFRSEINVGYRRNEVQNIAIQAGNDDGKGALSMIHALVNAYAEYDFDLGVIPYFGLGVGYGQVRIDAHNKPDTFQIDSTDDAFLWNLMAGVSVPFSDVTTFSLGYRYLATEDLNFAARITGIPGTTGRVVRQVDSEYDAHELVLGVRYSF